MTSERSAQRRSEYRIKKQVEEQAKRLARKIAGFLNGTLNLHYYVEIDGHRHAVFVDSLEEAACCHWLAEYLESWAKARYKWSQWPHRKKIEANYLVSVTEGGDWPKLTIRRKAVETVEDDWPVHRSLLRNDAPEPTDEQIDEIEQSEAEETAEENAWHEAVNSFMRYIVSPAYKTIRRCDRPVCGRYFVYDRPNETFCSKKCAKAEARRHSTARRRANDRQQTLATVQLQIDTFSRKSFAAQSAFKTRWGKQWERGIAEVSKAALVVGGLEPITNRWIRHSIRIGELKGPSFKPSKAE